jgi:hypothetical protein
MIYQDLYQFPEGHPPSPYDLPVRILNVGDVYLPAGLRLFAVGWIEEPGFTTDSVPEECIEALFTAYPDKIIPDGTRGWHTCTFCEEDMPEVEWKGKTIDLMGNGHYLVRYENSVYMAPALLLHYILNHHYRPPQVFIDAVMKGKFLTTGDLEVKRSEK